MMPRTSRYPTLPPAARLAGYLPGRLRGFCGRLDLGLVGRLGAAVVRGGPGPLVAEGDQLLFEDGHALLRQGRLGADGLRLHVDDLELAAEPLDLRPALAPFRPEHHDEDDEEQRGDDEGPGATPAGLLGAAGFHGHVVDAVTAPESHARESSRPPDPRPGVC